MDASSSQIQVRVLPEEVDKPNVLRLAVARQLKKEGTWKQGAFVG